MEEKNFLALQKVTTPEIKVEIKEKDTVFAGGNKYLDADEELLPITSWIKSNTQHNADIKPERIKYFYTTDAKKCAGRYKLGGLSLRPETEKAINNDFDYILSVHYKSWKELNIENKVIQLDKILCGIDIDLENKTKKFPEDSKEYLSNLRCYGAEKVLNSSESTAMAIDRIVEKEKQERKDKKEKAKNNG